MNEPQSMQELVDLAMTRHQTSVRQMSILAKENGYQVTYTTLNQILSGTYKSVPKAVTLRAIAWLGGVKEEVAFMAAGQPVPGPPFAEELPPGVDNLPAKARKAAIDMLRVLVDMNKEAADDATHMNQAGNAPAKESRLMASENKIEELAFRMYAETLAAYGEAVPVPALKFALALPKVEALMAAGLDDANPDRTSHGTEHRHFREAVTKRLEENLNDHRTSAAARQRPTEPHPDAGAAGSIPLPANYYDLAADSSRNSGAEEDARARECGEEIQDPGDEE